MHHSSVSWEITLLHFSSRNFILFWQKDPIKVPNFRLLISANFYFDTLHLLKVYKISAKKLQRSYVSWHWRRTQNLKKSLVSKMTRIWWILIWALKSLKNLHFDLSLSCKLYNVWSKKVQRSKMQNLKKNWLVVWKMM